MRAFERANDVSSSNPLGILRITVGTTNLQVERKSIDRSTHQRVEKCEDTLEGHSRVPTIIPKEK